MAASSAQQVEQEVGHPVTKWETLKAAIQDDVIKQFSQVAETWLDLMWTLDAYRIAGVAPTGHDIGALNRGKGNWFADLIALLLENRTHHRIAARTRVPGFSQRHQIDVAWPVRGIDPLVCCETKVMGAPGFGTTPSRAALSDFVNRRKELKFAATDLKLYRRQQETRIEHWGEWRQAQPPRSYFLWAARLEPGRDSVNTLVREARDLIDTYLDGTGLFAWQPRPGRPGYEVVPLPPRDRVTALDDVLYRIESYINSSVDEHGNPPPPVEPSPLAIPPGQLPEDSGDEGG